MNTKLAINLREGTVQAEGGEDFVRFIYQDFKESLGKQANNQPIHSQVLENPSEAPLLIDQNKGKKKPRSKKSKGTPEGDKNRVEYKPKFNSSLNLAELESFYDQWNPANNSEKILLFAIFLRDYLKLDPCTADDIYTCFFTLNRKGKTKIPEAFVQAFRDAQSRTHYIEFSAPQNVQITIAGQNHFASKAKGNKEANG